LVQWLYSQIDGDIAISNQASIWGNRSYYASKPVSFSRGVFAIFIIEDENNPTTMASESIFFIKSADLA
jgi:hypothetical protein